MSKFLLLTLGLAFSMLNNFSAMNNTRLPEMVALHPNHGIYNCSSSCFVNATIQMLYHIQPLRDFFVQARVNTIYQENSTTMLLMNFIDQLDASTAPIKSQDDEMTGDFGSYKHNYTGFRQEIVKLAIINRDALVSNMATGNQDARDLLFHFISKLNEDIQGYQQSWINQESSLMEWTNLVDNKAPWIETISRIFSTYANPTNYIYTRVYECLTCKTKEYKAVFNGLEIHQIDDPQLYADWTDEGRVKLRKEPATAVTLETLLRDVTFKHDPIEGLSCTICKTKTNQTRTVYFNQLPSVLILQNTYADAQKEYGIDVTYPKYLNLSNYCYYEALKPQAHYTLIGTIVKSLGHYWTFIHYGNNCYRYDDNTVEMQVSTHNSFTNEPWPSAIPGNPYILVYHRNDVVQNYLQPGSIPSSSQNATGIIATTKASLTKLGKKLQQLQNQLQALTIQLTSLKQQVDSLNPNSIVKVDVIIDGILASYIVDKPALAKAIMDAYKPAPSSTAQAKKQAFLDALTTISDPAWQADIETIRESANTITWPQ